MDTTIIKASLFVLGSALLAYASGKSLWAPRSHGFFRFFAWEAILGLIAVNCDVWFSNPWSVLQIVSWSLLITSLLLVVLGIRQLRVAGGARIQRQDETLLEFEKTSALVTSGIYRYIRHPLYSSLLFLAWGAFLKDVTWYSACLVAVATLCLLATAKADERECIRFFGSAYKEYMELTERFIPFLF